MRAAITMVLYGVSLLFVGWLTAHVAPPGANVKTAIYVSGGIAGLMVLCAIGTLLIHKHRKLGMIAVHVGILLPLLALAGPVMRLGLSLGKVERFNEAVEAGGVEVRVLTEETRDMPHPVGYQAVGIGATGALSLFAFGALLLHRPRVEQSDEDGVNDDAGGRGGGEDATRGAVSSRAVGVEERG